MINTDYFNKWNELDKSIKSNSSKERITKFIPTNSANNVFISNTYKLERSFSIEFNRAVLQDYSPQKVQGLKIVVKDNPKISHDKTYLIVSNQDFDNDEAFIGFSVTVFNAIEGSASEIEVLRSFENVLKNYNQYFKFARNISKQEEQGLLAELLYLNELLTQVGDSAVQYWFGLERNKRDFIIDNKGIEIKSTRNQEQDILHISNENQLDQGNLDQLLLKLYIFDENSSGLDLSLVIKDTYDRINAAEYKKMFISKINMHGIDPFNYESNNRFYLEKVKTYIINDAFPKITKGSIPSNAFDVKYKLNVSGIKCMEEAQQNG